MLDDTHAARLAGIGNFLNNRKFWEEDCDWIIPFWIFREEIAPTIGPERMDRALESIRRIYHGFSKDYFNKNGFYMED